MQLKRLEMYGFKSFADKTVLEFKSGITTVIGPNGSGKSNIADCIRWVLGEQSIKALRGNKNEDIIFSGTENRKPLGYAEASLVFDNSDSSLPIEYSEVIITRRLYRSGESGYFINKTPCRLKDILELFMDTGIGKDGYSIIGQGKIDEILSNKSEDRRHIFEEAAGIVKYRTRKNESEKKLEQTKLNLLRINDIVQEIETNLSSLEVESKKAKEYLSLRDELKEIEIGLFLYNIDDYKDKINKIKSDINIYEAQKRTEEEGLNSIQSERNEIKNSLDEITELIEKTQNSGFEFQKKEDEINNTISVDKERILNNDENSKRYKLDIKSLREKNVELENDKELRKNKKLNLKENRKKFQKELEEKQKELDKLNKSLTDKEKEIETKKKKVDSNIDKRYTLVADLNTNKTNLENLKKKEISLNNDLDSLIREKDSYVAQKSEEDAEFYNVESKRKNLINEFNEIKEKSNSSNKTITEFNNSINELENEYRVSESRLKFLKETENENEGYNRSVKEVLNKAKGSSEIFGTIANLITVPKEYEVCIDMALGLSVQNIVTKSEKDAKEMVEYLRREKLGRATFLPISTVNGQKLTNIKKTDGFIGIASDLVKYDKKYEGIILNLLGKTVIVDDLDAAINISKINTTKFKVVTLKGDVINPTGSITGGYVAPKTVNLIGRKNEIKDLEKDLKTLKVKIDKKVKEKEDFENSIKDIDDLLESKQSKLNSLEVDFSTRNAKIKSFEDEILKEESKIDKTKADLKQVKTDILDLEKVLTKNEDELSKVDKENETLNKEIDAFSSNNKDNQKQLDDLNFEVTNLKISVSSFDESELSVDEFIEKIDSDINANNDLIKEKEDLIDKAKNENKTLNKEILDLENDIKKQAEELLESSKHISDLKLKRDESNKKLVELEKDIEDKTNALNDIKSKISKEELKSSKLELELEQTVNKMWEDYEVTPNNTDGIEKVKSPSKVQGKVNDLRGRIKDLGDVNVNAIKEYDETKSRYDFMCKQKNDLENTSSKLNKLIQDIMKKMETQFSDSFKAINKNFKEVFIELFGGGKAELKLDDENHVLDSGIEIEVQPPGKKLQSMSLLSGGERALTAIALLFAILKLNPAPFCVLDEIEAALDDVNVYRFAEFLKKFGNDTQFLVITHRKGTMEAADTVYGITMEEKGISKLLSMDMKKN